MLGMEKTCHLWLLCAGLELAVERTGHESFLLKEASGSGTVCLMQLWAFLAEVDDPLLRAAVIICTAQGVGLDDLVSPHAMHFIMLKGHDASHGPYAC